MDWKLLFRGLGKIWVVAAIVGAVAAYINLKDDPYSQGDAPQVFLAIIGLGILGLAIFRVIAAACPEKRSPKV